MPHTASADRQGISVFWHIHMDPAECSFAPVIVVDGHESVEVIGAQATLSIRVPFRKSLAGPWNEPSEERLPGHHHGSQGSRGQTTRRWNDNLHADLHDAGETSATIEEREHVSLRNWRS